MAIYNFLKCEIIGYHANNTVTIKSCGAVKLVSQSEVTIEMVES